MHRENIDQSALAPHPDRPESFLSRASSRMRDDLRLAIVTLYCLTLVVIVGSFSIYRALSGELLVAVVDASIVLSFVALTALAWHPNWTRMATNTAAAISASAVVIVVLGLGLSYQWVFSTLVGNFLLAERRVALIFNTAMIVAVASHSGAFHAGDERAVFIGVAVTISLFSVIFASRIHSQRTTLTEMAERDGLTGAFNRRTLDRDLAALSPGRGGADRPISLAVFDLDNFKQLNDEAGHTVGDDVLTGVTRTVASMTRDSDRFYRYGGEEFVLLMPDTPLEGARRAVDKVRQAVTSEVTVESGKVTVSAGVAQRRAGDRPEAWLRRADQALLQAKRDGKDRVVSDPAI